MLDTTTPPLPVGAATAAAQANLQAAIGWQIDAPWDGVRPKASVISLLKAIALSLGVQAQQSDPPAAGPAVSPDGTRVTTVGPTVGLQGYPKIIRVTPNA